MDLLKSGHEYNELPQAYVIFICNFDPFEKGRYCYTFENRCTEDFSISMSDESRSIFLSTEGEDTENISEELKAFLKFVKTDNSENNTETEDAYVKELQQSIHSVKKDRELERGFMTWDDVRREAKKEGKKEDIVELLEELGEVPEDIKSLIMSETKEVKLNLMLKAVVGVTSFAEYREKISKL